MPLQGIAKRFSQLASRYSGVFDVLGLFLAIVVIATVNAFYIDPAATEMVLIAERLNEVPPRTIPILLKDIEQLMCLTLGLWCLWLWLFRYNLFQSQNQLPKIDYLNLENVDRLDEVSLNNIEETNTEWHREFPNADLLDCVPIAMESIRSKGDFKEASDLVAARCDLHLDVLNSKLDITKYILWAIPSIGFIGTVRGIGQALGQATEAMGGDISGVASSLGIAFNSTFLALLVSIVLMAFSYLLQGREERMVVDFKKYLDVELIGRLRALSQHARVVEEND